MALPVFDTNIVIDWLKSREPAILELERYPRHSISRVTWMEVLAGEPLETRNEIEDRLSFFEMIEIDSRIAAAAVAVRYKSRLKLLDAIVLATAQVNGSVLVTRNTKDFPPDMPGVRVPYTL